MVVLFKAGVVKVPDNDSAPLHPPAPIQALVLVDNHVNTEVDPIAIEEELALSVSVGGNGRPPTVIVADWAIVVFPSKPVHVSIKTAELGKAAVVKIPDNALEPVQAPDARQDSVFVDDHDNTEVAPTAIEAGLVVKVKVGAGGGATEILVV